MSNTNKNGCTTKEKSSFSHLGLVLGFAIGTAIGVISNNLALYMSLGALAGVALDECVFNTSNLKNK